MKKPKTYQQVIGETIEQMRNEKGWTQGQLAEAVGSSQSAIHRIEKGGQNVSLEMIKKLYGLPGILSRDHVNRPQSIKNSF